MKRLGYGVCFIFAFLFFSFQLAHADLNTFVRELNAHARGDLRTYINDLSTQFGIPVEQVQIFVGGAAQPADAFVCMELSRMSGVRVDKVFSAYKKYGGRGWGNVAQRLGIDPESEAFQTLQNGEFVFQGNLAISGSSSTTNEQDPNRWKIKK